MLTLPNYQILALFDFLIFRKTQPNSVFFFNFVQLASELFSSCLPGAMKSPPGLGIPLLLSLLAFG
jgi:hypothetical protein